MNAENTQDFPDKLIDLILHAREELLRCEIEANTVVLDGKRFGKLFRPGYVPSILGMRVEFASLPENYDFLVQRRPRTNADSIRAMTDEKLAEMGCYEFGCPPGRCAIDCELTTEDETCRACWLGWLREEVTND